MNKKLMDCFTDAVNEIAEQLASWDGRYYPGMYDYDQIVYQDRARSLFISTKLKAYIDSQVNEAVHERNTIGNEIIRAMEELAEAQVKAERAKLIRQIETISYECPYGYTHICLHKEEYETMVKQEEV